MIGKKSLVQKNWAMIAFNTVVIIIVGFFLYTSLGKMNSAWNNYKDNAVSRQSHLMEMKSQFGYGGFIHNFKNYVLRKDKKYVDRFNENRKKLEETIKAFKELNLTPEEQKAIKDIEKVAGEYTANFSKVTQMLSEEKTSNEIDQAVKVDDTPAFNAFALIKKRVLDISEENRGAMGSAMGFSKIILIAGFILVFAIITIFSLYIMNRFVIKPIKQLIQVSDSVADFDLSHHVDVTTEDEFGRLGRSFNEMIDHLREIVAKVSSSTDTIRLSTDEITYSSDDLATRTSEQAASITQTSATINQFTVTVKQNSENSEEASSTLTHFNQEIQSRNELMNNVTGTMKEIHESSQKIDNIVSVINDISFQTNLLALNAAVEAARAGEAGRGFAVVAAEVRNLAQKTAESSKSIQEIVSHNVESTQRGMELVEQTTEFFMSLVQVTQNLVDKIGMITTGSKEQSTGVEQINTAITQLEDVINQNAALVEELSATSREMKSNAFDLKELVGRFRLAPGAEAAPVSKPSTEPAAKRETAAPPPTRSEPKPEPKSPKSKAAPAPPPPAQTGDDDFFASDEGEFEEF